MVLVWRQTANGSGVEVVSLRSRMAVCVHQLVKAHSRLRKFTQPADGAHIIVYEGGHAFHGVTVLVRLVRRNAVRICTPSSNLSSNVFLA